MKHYKDVEKPATVVRQETHTTCDRCGEDVEKGRDRFDAFEVELQMKTGDSYSDCGSGRYLRADCCEKCFKEVVVPALEAAGFTFQEEEWDW